MAGPTQDVFSGSSFVFSGLTRKETEPGRASKLIHHRILGVFSVLEAFFRVNLEKRFHMRKGHPKRKVHDGSPGREGDREDVESGSNIVIGNGYSKWIFNENPLAGHLD